MGVNMTAFGWIYLMISLFGVFSKVNEIGKPREPVTVAEANAMILISVLLFAGLYFWGIRAI